jgi:pantetheine-phosphate adenylyltransferase
MNRIAVFPGSFDPVTKGHEEIVRRALPLFDTIIVALGRNTSKSSMFTLEQRKQWLINTFQDDSRIQVKELEGLTVDFCRDNGAQFILRGIRNSADFEYERSIAQMNKAMHPGIETVLLFSNPDMAAVNSTIIREIIKNKGDVSQFLPTRVNVYGE